MEHNLHWDKESKAWNKGLKVYQCKDCAVSTEAKTKVAANRFLNMNDLKCNRSFYTD